MPVLVDTDVVSYLFKRDSRARAFRKFLVGQVVILSFMTLAELTSWTLQRNWGLARREQLARFLQQYVVWNTDEDLCQRWAMVDHGARRRGRPIGCADAWIAATALALGIPLVTNNPDDYREVDGLIVLTA